METVIKRDRGAWTAWLLTWALTKLRGKYLSATVCFIHDTKPAHSLNVSTAAVELLVICMPVKSWKVTRSKKCLWEGILSGTQFERARDRVFPRSQIASWYTFIPISVPLVDRCSDMGGKGANASAPRTCGQFQSWANLVDGYLTRMRSLGT